MCHCLGDTAQLPPALPELSQPSAQQAASLLQALALENWRGENSSQNPAHTLHSELPALPLSPVPVCGATSCHPSLPRHPCWPQPQHLHRSLPCFLLSLNPGACSGCHCRHGGLQSSRQCPLSSPGSCTCHQGPPPAAAPAQPRPLVPQPAQHTVHTHQSTGTRTHPGTGTPVTN